MVVKTSVERSWFTLAFIALASSIVGSDAVAAESAPNEPTLQEVVVTAQKREERLQDVPMAVSVISADSLLQNNELALQDYYATVPGLAISDLGAGGKLYLAMRGLGGNVNPTVGVTIDDVPIGATVTGDINSNQYVPELDPADLARIEVLKGPQGTLYGASSIGGVLRYVTAAPDLATALGRIQVDGTTIPGHETGYGVRSAFNFPVISDMLAIRVSAFSRRDPGFVSDPFQRTHDVNAAEVYGGRIDTLWQVSPALSVRVGALVQRTEGYGDPTIDTTATTAYVPTYGDLTHERLPGTGDYSNRYQLYNATLKFVASRFEVVSVTGYGRFQDDENYDFSGVFGSSAFQFFPPAQGSRIFYPIDTHKLTEEVRLTSPVGSKLDWLLGGFYTDEKIPTNNARFYAADLATGTPEGLLLNFPDHSRYHEYAGFADLTYHFSEQFDVQLGARESHNWQHFNEDVTGPLQGPELTVSADSEDSSFTYLFTPRFRLSSSLMAYARIASGYQPGGPNVSEPGQPPLPNYKPSKTLNYELGIKAALLDGRLLNNADVFYIDWSDIQLTAFTPAQFPYLFNGGKARSEGVEEEIQFHPIESLSLNATVAYTAATLTSSSAPGFPGAPGNSLPYTSKWTGSLGAEQRFHISASTTGFVGASWAYVGKRYENYPQTLGAPQPLVPEYLYADVRAGVERDGFTISAFVKNVTDRRGILSSNPASAVGGPWGTAIIRPRAVGLSVMKQF